MQTTKPRRAPKDAPKPKTAPRPSPPTPRVPRLHPAVDSKYLAAITHPFSSKALGARVPDSGRKLGGGFSAKFRGNATTDATGAGRFVFTANPNCLAFPLSGVGVLGGDVRPHRDPANGIITGVSLPALEIAGLGNFRVVSCGLRLSSYVSDNTNGGRVAMGSFDTVGRVPFRNWSVVTSVGAAAGVVTEDAIDANWGNEDLISQLFGISAGSSTLLDYTEMTPTMVSLEELRSKDLIGVVRPSLIDKCPWINAYSGTAYGRSQDQSTLGLNCLMVTIDGATPSSNVLTWEYIVHYEAVEYPLRGLALAGASAGASAPVVNHPQAVDHTNAVAGTQPHAFQDGEVVGALGTAAASALAPYARAAGGAMMSRLSSLALGFLPELESALPLLLL